MAPGSTCTPGVPLGRTRGAALCLVRVGKCKQRSCPGRTRTMPPKTKHEWSAGRKIRRKPAAGKPETPLFPAGYGPAAGKTGALRAQAGGRSSPSVPREPAPNARPPQPSALPPCEDSGPAAPPPLPARLAAPGPAGTARLARPWAGGGRGKPGEVGGDVGRTSVATTNLVTDPPPAHGDRPFPPRARQLQIEISRTENSLDDVFCQRISAISVLTMDKCKHIGRLRLAQDHSILNPQKWHCVDCNTTESVWACLSCSHVACGRYIEEHALKHFQESSHPVALEVNELYVFCYLCDDYVLNDNATGDLKLLRSTLSAIKSQNYDCTTRSGRTLRSMATSDDSYLSHGGAQALLRSEDRMFTALWHRRHAFLGKIFRSWLELTPTGKKILEEERHQEEAEERRDKARKRRQERKRELKAEMEKMPPRKSSRLQNQIRMSSETAPCLQKTSQNMESVAELKNIYTSDEVRLKKISDSPIKRRPTVTPGVTGLRNLGNTCYMNSILQVLSHLLIFRECFLKLDLNQTQELLATAANGKTRSSSKHLSIAASTLHVTENQEKVKGSSSVRRPSLSSGLSGGASKSRNMELIQPREPSSKHISLCHELHTLFQVMWSGKWALVSPFAMLHSVWRLIPAFRGYAQQDAQEFLCELLDKVQQELETTGTRYPALIPASQRKLIKQVLNVVNNIFHGQLLSQVTCLACDNKSNTIEPFWDLSLEFPERYHCNGKEMSSQYPCLLTEMLAKFTETEALEGKIYACDQCNSE
ncbi:ubiquitin carboxyl-terminal hydrolase 44 isoform X2 [Grus americana]|uniref:ubiquitin carboxyl-terminal hydrolase 44 isoform X2 n=1 Tax=Grus americana TaxID=9117 RepID=UPI00240839C7|nr:ubiquitin carboxyl-terminal hydrolase 44 isoform X2 [Grus americana]